LDGSLLQANNPSNNIRVRYDPSPKTVFIDFDYLDKNQGAVIQVVHTGSFDNLNINGDIMGVQKLSQVDPKQLKVYKPMEVSDKRILGIALLVGIIGFYVGNFQRDFARSLFTLSTSQM